MNEHPGPWRLPDSWTWTTTGEVCEVVGGGTPRTSDTGNFDGGEIPWITPADLSGFKGTYIGHGARNITKRGYESSGATLMPRGTVLFSSRAPIGYVAIAANEVSTNQGFKSFIPPNGLKPEYLRHYLRRARDMAKGMASGTTFLELSGRHAAKLPLALAPTQEQGRIANALDSYFTRLDDAEATLDRVKRNLELYRASVLQAAVEGRLVPTEAELAQAEGRSFEPASSLVRRLSPDVIEVDGGAQEIPHGWTKVRLGSIAQVRLGRQRSPARSVGKNMRPYMRAANVTWDGINTEDVKEMDFTPREFQVFALRRGDILLSEASGSPDEVGKPAIWNEQIPDCCFQNTLVRVRADQCLVPFLYLHFLSDAVSGAFSRSSKGVGIHHLSAGTMECWPTRIPPLAEQRRIVAHVEDSLSVVRAVQQAVETDKLRCARLRQSLLAMAFQGRLVDQDPTDEPASVLLDRVRAERAKAASSPETPRRRGRPRMAVKK